ncbi:MAG: DNA replication and repair protein RecF [Chthoniobacteraceae bacterium]
MLTDLKLRDFRCFAALECELAEGLNFIVGPNAQGKTSLLEAACVLLRLQSPRVQRLGHCLKHGGRGFVVDGHFGPRHLQFYFSAKRKKLALDSVEQASTEEYLKTARVVWFGNGDVDLVRGGGDGRRRFLDFFGAQIEPGHRSRLRAYERALRSRNHLLRQPSPRWREIAAFAPPLVEAGLAIMAARRKWTENLLPYAQQAHAEISGRGEQLQLTYEPGAPADFASALAAAHAEDARLRQTTLGPHRDELTLTLDGQPATLGSEGQQRTLALALKLAQARLLENHFQSPPILLLDDIFGELDKNRRNALLGFLPKKAQKIITTTHLDWVYKDTDAAILHLSNATLTRE